MAFMGQISATNPAPAAGRAANAGPRPLLFLDFEASSLSPDSWPVEIGFAWIADGRVHSRGTVMAPRPEWALSDWSESAARVHGIGLGEALAGTPAEEVATETDRFADFDVVSDNPAWEQTWLDRLRADRPAIRVLPLRQAIRERLDEDAANRLSCALFRADPAHRAAADAERVASAWLATTCAEPVA